MTLPFSPTMRARGRVKKPGPQPMSTTVSPSRTMPLRMVSGFWPSILRKEVESSQARPAGQTRSPSGIVLSASFIVPSVALAHNLRRLMGLECLPQAG